jgi:DNA-binding response OmpR family regulator
MKILVVEDEIHQQEWLARNLSNTGHEVTTACKGGRKKPSICSDNSRAGFHIDGIRV